MAAAVSFANPTQSPTAPCSRNATFQGATTCWCFPPRLSLPLAPNASLALKSGGRAGCGINVSNPISAETFPRTTGVSGGPAPTCGSQAARAPMRIAQGPHSVVWHSSLWAVPLGTEGGRPAADVQTWKAEAVIARPTRSPARHATLGTTLPPALMTTVFPGSPQIRWRSHRDCQRGTSLSSNACRFSARWARARCASPVRSVRAHTKSLLSRHVLQLLRILANRSNDLPQGQTWRTRQNDCAECHPSFKKRSWYGPRGMGFTQTPPCKGDYELYSSRVCDGSKGEAEISKAVQNCKYDSRDDYENCDASQGYVPWMCLDTCDLDPLCYGVEFLKKEHVEEGSEPRCTLIHSPDCIGSEPTYDDRKTRKTNIYYRGRVMCDDELKTMCGNLARETCTPSSRACGACIAGYQVDPRPPDLSTEAACQAYRPVCACLPPCPPPACLFARIARPAGRPLARSCACPPAISPPRALGSCTRPPLSSSPPLHLPPGWFCF